MSVYPDIVFHIAADVGHDIRNLPTSEVATRREARKSDPISEFFYPISQQTPISGPTSEVARRGML
jgi:hypothetical protein